MFKAKDKLTGAFGSIKDKVTGEGSAVGDVAGSVSDATKSFANRAMEAAPEILEEAVEARMTGRSVGSVLKDRLLDLKRQEQEKIIDQAIEETTQELQESFGVNGAK